MARIRPFRAAALALCAALALPAAPARAVVQSEGTFDVVFRGMVAGRAVWRANEGPRAYAVSALLHSTGPVRLFADIRYVVEVTGARSGDRFLPGRYREQARTGRGQQAAVMAFRNGVPVVEKVEPPRAPGPDDLDPARERGVVDPLTALFLVLRDVPRDAACTARATVFDGRRRAQLTLARPRAEGDRITCAGEFRWLAGLPDEAMRRRDRFPFTLSYASDGNGGLRVVEVVIDTGHGPARLIRR